MTDEEIENLRNIANAANGVNDGRAWVYSEKDAPRNRHRVKNTDGVPVVKGTWRSDVKHIVAFQPQTALRLLDELQKARAACLMVVRYMDGMRAESAETGFLIDDDIEAGGLKWIDVEQAARAAVGEVKS